MSPLFMFLLSTQLVAAAPLDEFADSGDSLETLEMDELEGADAAADDQVAGNVDAPVGILIDSDDPRASEGVLIGDRGYDPGWKDPRVAERAPNVYGQTGIRRVNSARTGRTGYFDLGLSGRGFYSPNFIVPGDIADENTFVGGTGHMGVTLFDLLEIGIATQVASNENTRARPSTSYTTGDLITSLKLGYAALPFAFGADLRAIFPTAQDRVGVDFENFSLNVSGLLTLDFYESLDVPLKLHLNAGYTYQNAHALQLIQYYANDVPGYLLAMTTGQWYYDQLTYGFGLEIPLPHITPYAEIWGQMPVGVPSGLGPGGGNAGFFDSHLILTPGARISLGRGFNFDFAADLGLAGTGGIFAPDFRKITPGMPINPAYAIHFGVSYTFSPFVAQTQVEIREKELQLGRVRGCVIDAVSKEKVEDAFVEFMGTTGPRIVVDPEGCFISPRLDPAELIVKVRHPDYQVGSITVDIERGQTLDAEVRLVPAPRMGRVVGLITNFKDRRVEATIELRDDRGNISKYATDDGDFDIELKPGEYLIQVRSPGFLTQGGKFTLGPLGRETQNFILKGRPKNRISSLSSDRVDLSTQVPFEYKKSRLLRAAEFILDDVADLLFNNPQLKKLSIEGHTDDVGDDLDNKRLSEKRAVAVREYLISKGIPGHRLSTKGYGATRPISEDKSEEGRQKNRRIDFIVMEIDNSLRPIPVEPSLDEEDSIEDSEDEVPVKKTITKSKKKKKKNKKKNKKKKRKKKRRTRRGRSRSSAETVIPMLRGAA